MITPDNHIYDGWVALKGCDASRRPLEIPRTMVHRAVNCVFRGDQVGPRPAWRFRDLSTQDDAILYADFNQGRFQGAMIYTPDNGDPYILSSHGGRLFKIDVLNGGNVSDVSIRDSVLTTDFFTAPLIGDTAVITVSNTANFTAGMTLSVRVHTAAYTVDTVVNATQMIIENVNDIAGTVYPVGTRVEFADVNPGKFWRVWMLQAEKWAIIQDGESRPLIWDGAHARRAAANELPVGTVMAYGLGRVWVTGPDMKQFGASDLIYGPNGTLGEGYRDAILKWQENTFLAGGGMFRVPDNAGEIRAMQFISNLDTSTGQGPLQVFTENGAFSVNALIPRDSWNNYNYSSATVGPPATVEGQTPIQTVSLKQGGAESDRNLVAINSDFFFRSANGIRTFQTGRKDQGTWSNTPLSKQVHWALRTDPQPLLNFSSAVLHDDRYISTVNPQLTARGVIHKGLVALDMQQVTWVDNEQPRWDGLWTFSHIYQLVAGNMRGKDRCFSLTQNWAGNVELYELDDTEINDKADVTQETRIRWAVEFGSIAFPPAQQALGLFDLKTLKGAELNITDLQGDAWFRLRWRPEGYPCWIVWATFEECAAMGACGYTWVDGCKDWRMGLKQFRSLIGIKKPEAAVDAATGLKLNNFYAVQARLDVQGYCKIGGLRLIGGTLDQPVVAPHATYVTES